MKIKADAFAVSAWNGATVTLETKKNTDEPIIGASGETKRYALASGGSLYLREDQVEE